MSNILYNIKNDYFNNDNDNNNNYTMIFFKDINDNDIPYFSFKGKTFIAKHCNIYDGDTFSVIFEHNGNFIKYRCH